MKNKFKILEIKEHNIEGEITFIVYKIISEDNSIYEKLMNKTFFSYGEARRYIRIHEGI